jgi:hypothetical protein
VSLLIFSRRAGINQHDIGLLHQVGKLIDAGAKFGQWCSLRGRHQAKA